MNAFLADPALQPLWRAVTAALDRNGLGWRGRLTLPDLTPEGRRRLGVLIETRMPATRRTVSLDAVAAGVERLTGAIFVDALGTLGHPPAGRREAALARHDAMRQRRAALDDATAAQLGDAAWVITWRDAAWTDGLFARHTADEVTTVVTRVGQVLARAGFGRSRTEVAAQLFGDAHALDTFTRLATLVTRALLARDGSADERGAWERAGLPLDLVSAPVLTWALPVLSAGGVADAVRAMTAAGLPMQLSVLALRASPLTVAPGTPVLVVENPRLVEAAAERRLGAAVLCTNGNPTTAPSLAIAALRSCGARLRYHGDIDAPGLAMTGRARDAGCEPFRMSAQDYRDALADASAVGVELPRDPAAAPPTPWDPALAVAFDEHRAVVHEERVMDDVLGAHVAGY
ncbi:MAG: DUF2399 domain-containing protein [Pseudonocardiaceae bacterium]